jgi:UDP-glucose 4-epimerase
MRILITGGAGFIGSNLCLTLLGNKFTVAIVDDLRTGFKTNVPNDNQLSFYPIDISNASKIKEVVQEFKPNLVIHAAASYSNPDDWSGDVFSNVIGTINLLNSIRDIPNVYLIYLQTSLCYGLNEEMKLIDNKHPYFSGTYNGGSSYAISKTSAELFIQLSGINYCSLRLANVFGPKNFSGPIPAFYKNLIENKTSIIYNTKRDFLYIQDLVDCIIKIIETQPKKVYLNVSSGQITSIEKVFTLMANKLGKTSKDLFKIKDKTEDDAILISIDSSETKKLLNWKPLISIEEGITKTIEYYHINGVNKTTSHLKLN